MRNMMLLSLETLNAMFSHIEPVFGGF